MQKSLRKKHFPYLRKDNFLRELKI